MSPPNSDTQKEIDARLRSSGQRKPLKPGEHIEHYLIEAAIGGGGFSIVYRCFNTKSGDSVVLKEYFPNQLANRNESNQIQPNGEQEKPGFEAGMNQFFAEAMALSKIKHPNVIKIDDIFRSNNTVYMVSKLQEGKDLRWLIKRSKDNLDEAFLFKTIPPIMSGLDVLHEKGFLHLDVKPANILLRTEGGPWLLDFGAAKTISRKERFTSFQTLTPGFAPPEQHQKGELGRGSDIYALGATVYACIAGKAPPTSPERQEQSDELDFHGSEKKISAEIIDAVKWALQLDIGQRPKDIAAFADKLMAKSQWGGFAAYQRELLG